MHAVEAKTDGVQAMKSTIALIAALVVGVSAAAARTNLRLVKEAA